MGIIPGEPVISLYFDSPDLLFYRQSFAGLRNRVKLRVRFYDNDWKGPAFLEIKRRMSDVICKDRAMISREVVRQSLRQGWSSLLHGSQFTSLDNGKRQAQVQQQFSSLCNTTGARAMVYVSYVREAFVGGDDGDLRVTLDRKIRATRYEGEDRVGVPRRGVRPNVLSIPPDSVVLELKFNRYCPRWMQHMVRMFNLNRRSISKYCICAEALGLPLGRRALTVPQLETVA